MTSSAGPRPVGDGCRFTPRELEDLIDHIEQKNAAEPPHITELRGMRATLSRPYDRPALDRVQRELADWEDYRAERDGAFELWVLGARIAVAHGMTVDPWRGAEAFMLTKQEVSLLIEAMEYAEATLQEEGSTRFTDILEALREGRTE